jgi:hypothetical protein
MQVFCRFLGTHLLQYASLIWMKSAYKCLQSCPLLKQRWRSYFRVTDFYKSLSPLSLIITATINTITITASPLPRYHHYHNITSSPLPQYHHYRNITTITASPLSQHHRYHKITTITISMFRFEGRTSTAWATCRHFSLYKVKFDMTHIVG